MSGAKATDSRWRRRVRRRRLAVVVAVVAAWLAPLLTRFNPPSTCECGPGCSTCAVGVLDPSAVDAGSLGDPCCGGSLPGAGCCATAQPWTRAAADPRGCCAAEASAEVPSNHRGRDADASCCSADVRSNARCEERRERGPVLAPLGCTCHGPAQSALARFGWPTTTWEVSAVTTGTPPPHGDELAPTESVPESRREAPEPPPPRGSNDSNRPRRA